MLKDGIHWAQAWEGIFRVIHASSPDTGLTCLNGVAEGHTRVVDLVCQHGTLTTPLPHTSLEPV